MKQLIGLFFLINITTTICSQTLLEDDFTRANSTTVGNAWLETETTTAGAQIFSNRLQLGSTTAGRDFVYKDFSGSYPTVFSSAAGILTWAFNFRNSRTDPSGFDTGNYGIAFIIGKSTTDIATGDGYAIIVGNSGASDPIRLTRFTGGVNLNADFTSIISGGDFGNEYISVRVVYNPTGSSWSLFVESNGSSFPHADPRNTATQVGVSTADNTFTGNDLRYMGPMWNHGTAADNAIYDDIYRPQISSNTITTGTVTGAPFTLANCLATAAGSVDFISTGVFNGPNVYTAQLSDGSGSFANPVSIGTLASTANLGTINIVIPAGTPTGAGYKIRVIASDPITTGSNSSDLAITQNGICSSSATDHFRSRVTGSWGDAGTWESSPDNTTWINATLSPTSGAATVTVRLHNVTIATNVTIDEVTVNTGGTLTLSSNFTLNNGTGVDLLVNGTVVNTSGIHTVTGTTIIFNGFSLYQHPRNGGAILNSTWNATSTVEMTGYTNTAPTGLGQTFGNFTWDNIGQTNTVNINTGNFATQSLFLVKSTGASSNITLIGDGTDRTFNFGSLRVDAGILNFSFRNTSPSGLATVNVTGNVIINGGSLDFGAGTGNPASGIYRSILNIGGNLLVASGTIFRNSNLVNRGRVRFTNSGNQTVTINSGATVSRLDYHIQAGSITQMLGNINVNFVSPGDLDEIIIDGVLNAGAAAQITGGGNLTLNGTLITAHPGGIGATGTLANTGINTIGASSTIEYNGTGPQVFSARPDYANIIFSGGGAKILDGLVAVSGNFNLENGKVVSTTTNMLTILASATITGGSNNSYVEGPVTRHTAGATGFVLPVGKGGAYRPVTVIPVSATASVYTGEYFNSGYGTVTICDPTRLDAVATNEYWNLVKVNGVDAMVTLPYTAANTWSNSTTPALTDVLVVAHFAASCWQDETGTFLPGTSGPGNITSRTLSSYGPFTIGYGPLIVLPVNYGVVRATQQSTGIKIEWSNLTETGVLFYSVDRSTNGIDFVAIGTVHAIVNNGGRADYSFVDYTAWEGVNYYRITTKSTNDSTRYSAIVKVNTKVEGARISLYPNPVPGNQVSVQGTALAKGLYTIRITNVLGQPVLTQSLKHTGGSVTETLQLPVALKSGLYNLQVTCGAINYTKTFIIQ